MSTPTIDFDPSRYLTKVSGSDYLEVKWRLLWLRQTHPDASIETELVTHDGQAAMDVFAYGICACLIYILLTLAALLLWEWRRHRKRR